MQMSTSQAALPAPLIFARAFASIWRTRSRVTDRRRPISSRVYCALDAEAISEPQDFSLPIGERRHGALDFRRHLPAHRRLFGVLRRRIGDEVAEPGLLLFSDRRLERRRRLRRLEEQLHLADREFQLAAGSSGVGSRSSSVVRVRRSRVRRLSDSITCTGRRMVRP